MTDKRVGVLGGGQLGRMLIEAANRLNVTVNVLDAPNAPAKQISNHDGHINGSFKDPESIRQLAKVSDVVTVEIEHVDTHVLEEISSQVIVEPHWRTLRTIQNKYLQKEHLRQHSIPIAPQEAVDNGSEAELRAIGTELGYPFMLKSRTEAYDGKGNFPVRSEKDIPKAIEALGKNPLYAEQWAEFSKELAVMVVKTKDGVLAYPTVETVHEDSVCKLVFAPARVSEEIRGKAEELARKAVACFEGKGVFGVEMFLLPNNTLLINEIAPRPHNSGHYTIEACPLSQYAAHLRAILDLPITPSSLRLLEPAIMLNILGGPDRTSIQKTVDLALKNPNISIHLYGKGASRPGRKMGHMTITAPTMTQAESEIAPILSFIDSAKGISPTTDLVLSSKSRPPVAVICGSDSDFPALRTCYETLATLQIPYYAGIVSAHRTPDRMIQFARSAASNGLKVIIAAAGGAAHLPGMTASETPLPVIGVPIKPSIGDGWDSVVSMTQMPRGTPVATVGVNNGVNAALLAARILGVDDAEVRKRVDEYRAEREKEVLDRNEKVEEVGVLEWLKQKEAGKK